MYIKHPLHPAGYRQIQLTEFVLNIIPPLDSVRVTIQPTGQNIRVRDDSIDPSTTVGLQILKDSTYVLDSDTRSLRIISENSTNAAVAAEATLASVPVNSDLTFTAVDTGPEWNGYDFEIVADAVVGVNSTATLGINSANGYLVFTAPDTGVSYDGTNFTANSAGAESVNYSANSFILNYNAATSNGATMKAAFDAALGANPTWPQWSCADDGDGSGVWDVIDDEATIVSAGGVTAVPASIDFAANTFTIHTYSAVTTANDVVVLWTGGPANCADWTCIEEGDGTGVVAAANAASANGADAVGALVGLLWHKEL
jgi:hypothetical protein